MTIITVIVITLLLPAPLFITAAIINRKTLTRESPLRNSMDLTRACLSAGVSLSIALLSRPFTFLDRIPLRKKSGAACPILMVHGLYHNKMAWLPMRHRLNFRGYSNLRTWQYNSFTTSYPELVLQLRAEINRLYDENGEKVMLIGHSLGGLLISGAADHEAIEKKVLGLITIGTPFKGSILANIAIGHLGRSLHAQSSLFCGGNKISSPSGIPKTAIISPTDEMVQPWENMVPEQDWKCIRTAPMGHVALLYSSETADKIAHEIQIFKTAKAQKNGLQVKPATR